MSGFIHFAVHAATKMAQEAADAERYAFRWWHVPLIIISVILGTILRDWLFRNKGKPPHLPW